MARNDKMFRRREPRTRWMKKNRIGCAECVLRNTLKRKGDGNR